MASRTRLRVALFLAVGMTTTGLALLAYGSHLIAPGSGWDVFGGAELEQHRPPLRDPRRAEAAEEHRRREDRRHDVQRARAALALHAHRPCAGDQEPEGGRRESDRLRHPVQRVQPRRQAGIVQDNAFMDASRAAGNLVFSTTEVNDKGAGQVPRRRSKASRTRARGSATATSTPTRAESSAGRRIRLRA